MTDFLTRLTAALNMTDRKSNQEEVTEAFEMVVRVFTEYNFALDQEIDSGKNKANRDGKDDTDNVVYIGGKRVGNWIRLLSSELSDLTMTMIVPQKTDIIQFHCQTSFIESLTATKLVFDWLTKHIERLSKLHVKSLKLGRGFGKTAATLYKNVTTEKIMAAGAEVQERINATLYAKNGGEVQPVNPEVAPTIQQEPEPAIDAPMPW